MLTNAFLPLLYTLASYVSLKILPFSPLKLTDYSNTSDVSGVMKLLIRQLSSCYSFFHESKDFTCKYDLFPLILLRIWCMIIWKGRACSIAVKKCYWGWVILLSERSKVWNFQALILSNLRKSTKSIVIPSYWREKIRGFLFDTLLDQVDTLVQGKTQSIQNRCNVLEKFSYS